MKLGLKMRYNEPPVLDGFHPRMIELHLADEDLSIHRREVIDAMSVLPDIPIIIHTPISLLIKAKRLPLVDISSTNEKLRGIGLETIRETMELMGELDAEYIIIHPGSQTPAPVEDTGIFMANLLGSLTLLELDYNTREMLIENMPLHHWMWGDEECWYSNLLRTPDEFAPILEYVNITLDICHAYLAVEGGSNGIIFDFLRTLGRWIKHIHLSDAAAPDKEGLQFGEGEIELKKVFRTVLDLDVTAIHEIRGGHQNDREGMREALRRYNAILLGHEYS